MVIKIRIRKMFINIWLIFWLVCNTSFFLLPEINNRMGNINSYHNKLLLTVLSIGSIGLYAIFFMKREFKAVGEIKFLVFCYIFFVTLILFYQLMIQDVGVVEALSSVYYNYILLACYLIMSCYKQPSEIERVIRWIMIIGVLFAIVNIVCFYAVNYFNILLTDVPVYQMANRNIRLPQSSDFVALAAIFFIINFIENKKKSPVIIFGAIVCLFELFFVAQVRMILLAVIVAIMVEVYLKSKSKYILIGLASIIIIGILLEIMINNNISIVSLFLGEGKRYKSALYRLVEIKHFVKYIFANGWFGFGFSKDSSILMYSVTDIGIIGFISRFGLVGIIWLFFFCKYLFRKYKQANNGYSRTLIMFLLICFISLSPFDSQRIVFLPFELLIIDNCKYKYL